MRVDRPDRNCGGGDIPLQPLRPCMRTVDQKAGDTLFRPGDAADRLYVIVKGEIVLEQIDHVLPERCRSALDPRGAPCAGLLSKSGDRRPLAASHYQPAD